MGEAARFPPEFGFGFGSPEEEQQTEEEHQPTPFEETVEAAQQVPPPETKPLPEEELLPFFPGFPKLEIPPFDWGISGVFAGICALDQLAQEELGYGIEDQGFAEAVEEVVAAAEDCEGATPEIDPERFAETMAAGALAWGVGFVRDRLGVDLMGQGQPRDIAVDLAGRMANRGLTLPPQPPPVDPQGEAAQRAMSWLPVAQLAGRLDLSAQTTQGLTYLRGAVDWISRLRSEGTGQSFSQLNAQATALAAVRQNLNIDPTAAGARAAIDQARQRAEEITTRAKAAMETFQSAQRQASPGVSAMMGARGVDAARNVAHGAAAGIMKGLPTSVDQVPILKRALPVLSTLSSVRQATGRSPVRRPRGPRTARG
ncbi:hypothetical protein ACFSM5_15280 [Lacibacterium aquatile]|uniref:Uncharacterized protein n=1 Tax=Lacibacterium aquatile TaxID=1168082 RepID=A0ABW5DUY1_9PROT